MRYLALALFREGPTDQRFFEPLLRRAVADLCIREAGEPVDIGDVVELPVSADLRSLGLVRQVSALAEKWIDSFDLLFLHTDSGNDLDGAYAERIRPAFADLERLLRARQRAVAVVPVREMEAWALADGDALRSAFGTGYSDEQLGVPRRAADVERLPDPKAVLERAYRTILGKRRPRARAAAYFTLIGESVSLERLRAVPAFQRFEEDLRNALQEIHILPRAGRGRPI